MPILFLHGYCQSAISWSRQLYDRALAEEFRLVAVDLRGHCMSGQPVGDAFYREGRRWADDIRAVMEALSLRRPVLVGWSYGGRVIGDYLTHHGTVNVGATNWVCAVAAGDAALFAEEAPRLIGPTTQRDPLWMIRATETFLRACFERQPSEQDLRIMLAFNMMVPRHVRLSLGGRPAEYEAALRALDVPTLVTQGERDRLIRMEMARFIAARVPGARLSAYEGIGHSPFFEDAPRFNTELAALARSARR